MLGSYNVGLRASEIQLRQAESAQTGIDSLRIFDREMLAGKILPILWRASTDNDRGSMFAHRNAAFYAASKFPVCHPTDTTILKSGVENVYTFPVIPDLKVTVKYVLNVDSSIDVSVSYSGTKLVPSLPLVGLRIPLSPNFTEVTYFGRGPVETYSDRKKGILLGQYTLPFQMGIVSDEHLLSFDGIINPFDCVNVPANPRPQDAGNRTDVRWISFTTEEEESYFSIEAVNRPLQVKILDRSPFDLEEQEHWEKSIYRPEVEVIGFQRGVGGDDSWGAPVYPEYELPADKPLSFRFRIVPNDPIW